MPLTPETSFCQSSFCLPLASVSSLLSVFVVQLMGRKENFDVIEVPESVPNLLGQVPLEVLDLVVDSKGQRLIPNPAHRGEQMTEEY